MGALGRVQKRMLFRFHAGGQLEARQRADPTSRLGHVLLAASRETFGMEDWEWGLADAAHLVCEVPLRPLLAALQASEGMDAVGVEVRPEGSLVVTSGSEYFSCAGTSHQIPVGLWPAGHGEGAFQEPLIDRPAISFALPAASALAEKLLRLSRQVTRARLAANHRGRFVCRVEGEMVETELATSLATVHGPAGGSADDGAPPQARDEHALLEVEVSAPDLLRALSCMATNQAPVLCALTPGRCLLLSAPIPDPCGPDRPAGSLTIILAAASAGSA